MVKPDGVNRGLCHEVMKRFEQRGFKLLASKLTLATEELLKQHYAHLVDKPFFPDILSFMTSGPVFCMVWEGKNACSTGRKILGETNPQASAPGTIRGDFGLEIDRNICMDLIRMSLPKRKLPCGFLRELFNGLVLLTLSFILNKH